MKSIPFFKYQGAGNDFILIDQRSSAYLQPGDEAIIRQLCDRRFGIGADGLMLLEPAPDYDFRMVYFNADGREGSMCGNGGRCIVAFARHLGITGEQCRFLAIDGPHEARLTAPDYVELQMQDVDRVDSADDHYVLDTGSPHYISFRDRLEDVSVVEEGRRIRYSPEFAEQGINVNFVSPLGPDELAIATYERGVEDETLACGTGVTAAALAYFFKNKKTGAQVLKVRAKGGNLEVRFSYGPNGFRDIWLCGPAKQVFSGKIKI